MQPEQPLLPFLPSGSSPAFGLQPGTEFPALVQIRAPENTMIDMDILSLNQLPNKAASQRGADCAVDSAIKVIFNIFFYFLSDCDHIRKDQITAVKAIVIYTDQEILLTEPVQHSGEIRLIITGRSRQKHQGLSGWISHFNKLHCYAPPFQFVIR